MDSILEQARDLDREDVLRDYQEAFVIDDPDLIYLDGNSLGRMPRKTVEVIRNTMAVEWGKRLIRSWNEEWMAVSERIGGKIAKLIGAKPNEVVLTDTTSINLYKLACAVLNEKGERRKAKGSDPVTHHPSPFTIISDNLNFPSDLYIIQGLIDQFGSDYRLALAESRDGISIAREALEGLLDSHTALVTLTHVCFKTAFMYDMKRITQMVHEAGSRVIWDLSHAAGAVPVDLNGSKADMAVGCTYKYLNGGPGSIAYLYVRKDLQDRLLNPIWGWFADADPFQFDLAFNPSPDIRRFQASSPPILSAKAVEPGVDLLLDAGMDKLREKSLRMTDLFIELSDRYLDPLGFELRTPRKHEERGSHVSLSHPEAYRISQSLIHPSRSARVIIPDFRAPDLIRFGFAPIYNTFEEVALTVSRIREIVDQKEFEGVSPVKPKVT